MTYELRSIDAPDERRVNGNPLCGAQYAGSSQAGNRIVECGLPKGHEPVDIHREAEPDPMIGGWRFEWQEIPPEAAPIESSVPTKDEINAWRRRNDQRINKLAQRGLVVGREPNTGNDMLHAARMNFLIEYLLGDDDAPARREFEAKLCQMFDDQLTEIEKSAPALMAKSRLIVPGA